MAAVGESIREKPRTSAGKVKLNVAVTPAQYGEIEALRGAADTPVSTILRELIEDGLRIRRLRRERDAAAIEAAV